MKIFENEIKNDPEHIQLSTCLADAPTMTIQGVLKFLTGSYQSYLEIANQLKHDDEMLEDSFISQAIAKGLKVKYFGGDSIISFFKSSIKDDFVKINFNYVKKLLQKVNFDNILISKYNLQVNNLNLFIINLGYLKNSQ